MAELNSEVINGNAGIRHNRFYIPTNAQSLEFFERMESTEVFRTGTVTASLRVGAIREPIGSFQLTATSSQYAKHTFPLHNTAFGNVAGQIMQVEFELSYPGQTDLKLGTDTVWLDDTRLISSQPLNVGASAVSTNELGNLTSNDIDGEFAVAQSYWGNLVEVPDRQAGVASGLIIVPTEQFPIYSGKRAETLSILLGCRIQ